MKTTVFLIRHGDIYNPKGIIYGRTFDLHLSSKGIGQIKKLALKLKKENIEKIYTSPLSRARETAIIISKVIKSDVVVDENLTETNSPLSDGLPLSELYRVFSPDSIKRGNESPLHVAKRMKMTFEEILKRNEGGIFAIVSHGDPIRFLDYVLENPGKTFNFEDLSSFSMIEKGTAIKIIIEKNKILDKSFIS